MYGGKPSPVLDWWDSAYPYVATVAAAAAVTAGGGGVGGVGVV